MCFDAKTSFITGTVTILTSLILIRHSPSKYQKPNKKLGIFFIYIALVQYLEWLMWSDQSCQLGYNQLATILIPYIVYLQPLVFYYVSGVISPTKTLVNLLYAIWAIYQINISKLPSCSLPNQEGHLDWNGIFRPF